MHDYSIKNISAISQGMTSCVNVLKNVCLSTESVPYSWDDGVVTWAEVAQVNLMKSEFMLLLLHDDLKLGIVSAKIKEIDSSASSQIQTSYVDLRSIDECLEMLNLYLSDTIPIPKF